jgi:hypothetical protein
MVWRRFGEDPIEIINAGWQIHDATEILKDVVARCRLECKVEEREQSTAYSRRTTTKEKRFRDADFSAVCSFTPVAVSSRP